MTREEAIEYLDKLYMQAEITDEYGDLDDTEPYETAIEIATEALQQPEQKWIPCSERLPEKDDCVFVYLFGDSPYIAWYDGFDWCTNDFALEKDEEPIAWMPLPEPYQEDTP